MPRLTIGTVAQRKVVCGEWWRDRQHWATIPHQFISIYPDGRIAGARWAPWIFEISAIEAPVGYTAFANAEGCYHICVKTNDYDVLLLKATERKA